MLRWFLGLPNLIKDSFHIMMTVIGILSTFCTVLGISLSDWNDWNYSSIWMRLVAVSIVLVFSYIVIYLIIKKMFKESVQLQVRGTTVVISYGDIFEVDGWKVIGCDSHFDTRVDDIVISKNSLHGNLMLKHGNIENILEVVKKEAERLQLNKNKDGLYDFPLGTIIRYDSKVSGKDKTYLLLAMMKLDEEFRACTNMSEFENMLMKMWKEIDRVYAGHSIVIPLLGTGISRFNDCPKNSEMLLRCLLCTLNVSGVCLNSVVKIVIYDKTKIFPFYEYRYMFNVYN